MYYKTSMVKNLRIGYACMALSVLDTKISSCMIKNANSKNLMALTKANLKALGKIIEYNYKNNIKLFRISSDIIPFGSNAVNQTNWEKELEPELGHLARQIKAYDIKVSMHPGQYTVLNSENSDVVKRAIEDLIYHNQVLRSLGSDDSKIILHIGGSYKNKEESLNRFKRNFNMLPREVQDRIAIENDDVVFNVLDVLSVGEELNIPVIYDVLHNQVNPSPIDQTDLFWIEKCGQLWSAKDGVPKVHYSQQQSGAKRGSHSKHINILQFMQFYSGIKHLNLDIMLEVKDKNISALKCINSVSCDYSALAQDAHRYRFLLFKRHPSYFECVMEKIRLKEQVSSIYSFIEKVLSTEGKDFEATAHYINDLMVKDMPLNHIQKFDSLIDKYRNGKISETSIKNFLYKNALLFNRADIYDDYLFSGLYN